MECSHFVYFSSTSTVPSMLATFKVMTVSFRGVLAGLSTQTLKLPRTLARFGDEEEAVTPVLRPAQCQGLIRRSLPRTR